MLVAQVTRLNGGNLRKGYYVRFYNDIEYIPGSDSKRGFVKLSDPTDHEYVSDLSIPDSGACPYFDALSVLLGIKLITAVPPIAEHWPHVDAEGVKFFLIDESC